MITKLYLQNFRSIKDKIELPLSPLTVFAGANSSGKSTVLKALLLISQTFRHRDKNCPILLNGPLVSLGSFDSIINSEKSTTEIIFGFDIGASHAYQVTTGSRYKNNTFFVKSGTYIFSLIEKDGSDKNKIEISKLSFRILRGQDIWNFGFDGQYEDYWEAPQFEDEIYLDKKGSGYLSRRKIFDKTTELFIPLSIQSINHHFNRTDFEITEADEKLTVPNLLGMDEAFRRGIRDNFIEKVLYIGPLREDPKPFYSISLASSIEDIGIRGENMPQIYDQNKDRYINFVSPKWFSDNAGSKISAESKTLEEALSEWMAYLGIGHGIKTVVTDYWGVIRVAMNLEKTKYRSINHVGVGVSQVLPILILGLLSKEQSTLLFEQPELHLHPKVQSKLADFFLSLTLMKKQVIIESHSEHIVNRLRLRMVQGLEVNGNTNFIADNTKIYFCEKKNSVSKYSAVRIDSFNCGNEWPEGFFDENETLVERITKAAIKKRKNNSSNN